MRGAGRTDRPLGPFSPTDDVAMLLRQLGVARAPVVGASLGGRTALDLALDHPDLVPSLVLAGPGLAGFDFSLDYQQMMVSILGTLALGDVDGYVAAFLGSALGPRSKGNQSVVTSMLIDNRHLFAGDAAHLRTSEPPARERLAAIHVPVLVMVGDDDHPDILEIGRRLVAGIDGAQHRMIAEAGHLVNLDVPVEFNRVVREFLEANRVAR